MQGLYITQDLLQFPLMPFNIVTCNIFVLTCLMVIYKYLYSVTKKNARALA